MTHSKYKVVEQLQFSLEVCETLQLMQDKVIDKESLQTLSFLQSISESCLRKDMKQILLGLYSVGSLFHTHCQDLSSKQ